MMPQFADYFLLSPSEFNPVTVSMRNHSLPAIQMVDLKSQYTQIKAEIDEAVLQAISAAQFVNGPQVKEFEDGLGMYLNATVVSCANGTDALQIALMALGLRAGDEVIVPSFTYVACAEVIALLGLVPVWADVDSDTFNLAVSTVEALITPKTRAIIVVHLFGQCAPMESLMRLAEKHDVFIIEDNAQSLGAEFIFSDGTRRKAGTIGHVGCTSFFPSKILGCFGDGGALICKDTVLAAKLKMIANHGQKQKYHHESIGVNSRLDTIQAAVLNVKLKSIEKYILAREEAAVQYDEAFAEIDWIEKPVRYAQSTHVYHQYTLKVTNGRSRDKLKAFLAAKGIPSMIYYPMPLHKQVAYSYISSRSDLSISEGLCNKVLSLPMHTELHDDSINYIVEAIRSFCR